MNRLATVIALCGLALGGALSTHRGPDQEDPSAVAFGIVTAVVDGDTVRVKDREERDLGRIRLLGVNAPELAHDDISAQCWGKQAHTRLAELTPVGATVRLVLDPTQADRDAHGRLLRYVLIDDLDVQHLLLAEGQARAFWPKGPGLQAGSYLEAAQQAEHDQRGLWAACTNRKDTP